MPGMFLHDEFERRVQTCDERYRKASLQLDRARLAYYALRTASSTDPRLDQVLDEVLQLSRQREALRAELDRLEAER